MLRHTPLSLPVSFSLYCGLNASPKSLIKEMWFLHVGRCVPGCDVRTEGAEPWQKDCVFVSTGILVETWAVIAWVSLSSASSASPPCPCGLWHPLKQWEASGESGYQSACVVELRSVWVRSLFPPRGPRASDSGCQVCKATASPSPVFMSLMCFPFLAPLIR